MLDGLTLPRKFGRGFSSAAPSYARCAGRFVVLAGRFAATAGRFAAFACGFAIAFLCASCNASGSSQRPRRRHRRALYPEAHTMCAPGVRPPPSPGYRAGRP